MANPPLATYGSAAGSFSLRTVFARLHDWNDARRTRNALAQLTAEELDDIGLVPGDIDDIAQRRR